MTSTEFTVGIGDSARVSSKVLKPPGGGSSDIFGLGSSQAAAGSDKEAASGTTHSRLFGDPSDSPPAVPQKKNTLHQSSIFENGELPPPTRGKKAFALEETANAPSKPVTTSIRVRNPPGGKSSGIF